MMCGSCKNRSVGGTDRLHHQGGNNKRIKNNVSSKLQLILQEPHDVISQKTAFSIVTAVKTSKLTYHMISHIYQNTRRHIVEPSNVNISVFITIGYQLH
jgi:hypothetical protein